MNRSIHRSDLAQSPALLTRLRTTERRTKQWSVDAAVTLRRYLLFFVSSALVTGICGCGRAGRPCSVQGTVTFNSAPIPKGAIRFVTEDGTPGNGGLGPITEGKFSVKSDGMMAGKYLVVISGFEETGRKFKADANGPELNEERQYIPARYNSNSTLTVLLKPGANTEGFDLSP